MFTLFVFLYIKHQQQMDYPLRKSKILNQLLCICPILYRTSLFQELTVLHCYSVTLFFERFIAW